MVGLIGARFALVPLFARIIGKYDLDGDATILDVGCGPLRDKFHELYGLRYVGTDIESSEYPKDIVMNAEEIPEDWFYKIVTAWSVIEHVENPMTALKKMIRTAEKVVLLSTDFTEYDKNNNSTHLYSWTSRTFQNLLKHTGHDFKVWTENEILFAAINGNLG